MSELDVDNARRTLHLVLLTVIVLSLVLGAVHLSAEKVPAAHRFESIETLRPCR